MLKRSAAILALLVVGGLVATSVIFAANPETGIAIPEPVERDLGAILERDTLVALTSYTSTSYFLYRGQAFGFEYELLRDFAEEQDVVFQIEVVPRDSILYYLNTGRGDIAAARLQPTEEDTASFGFTVALYETNSVVVQQGAPFDSTEITDEVYESVAEDVPQEIADRLGDQVGDQVGTGPRDSRLC